VRCREAAWPQQGRATRLAPGVAGGAAELEEERRDEDEHVLQEHRHAGVHGRRARHHIAAEQHPGGAQQRAEAHHEPHEEPDLGAEAAQAAALVGVPRDLRVAHRVYHEHGDGGKHAAQVVHVAQLRVERVHAGCVYHDPPPH